MNSSFFFTNLLFVFNLAFLVYYISSDEDSSTKPLRKAKRLARGEDKNRIRVSFILRGREKLVQYSYIHAGVV